MIKLQHLAVIFAIIIIPVSLVLGYYIRSEIDTLKLQASYDEKLINATYDGIKAYQINTSKNAYSIIDRSKRRDIEAAINTFITSFATGMGVGGYGENAIKPYIPAVLFTLYDGYFIYAPTLNEASNKYEHILKPYISYTQRYVRGTIDIYVTYSIDNYITITGYDSHGNYVNRSGYLINDNSDLNGEELKEQLLFYDRNASVPESSGTYRYVFKDGDKRYYSDQADSLGRHWFIYREGEKIFINNDSNEIEQDVNAKNYMTAAKEFTDWVQSEFRSITIGDLVLDGIRNADRNSNINNGVYGRNNFFGKGTAGGNYKIFVDNDFEDVTSIFNQHKNDMVRISIRENLSMAIAAYNAHSNTTGEFLLPELKESEWERITKNISMVSFVQGLPVGFKTYNNYAIINNTRNETYAEKEALAFIDPTADTTDQTLSVYHMIDCPKLAELVDSGSITNLIGYRKIDFEPSSVEVRETVDDSTTKKTHYYYKHINLPCYYCIVSKNYEKVAPTGIRLTALKYALGRERQILHN